MEQAQHVASHGRQLPAFRELGLDIGQVSPHRRFRRHVRSVTPIEPPVRFAEQPGFVIGRAAQHHPIDALRQVRLGLVQRMDAAVDQDGQVRPLALQPVDQRIVERGDVAVLLGAQALQPRLAGMHHEGGDAFRRAKGHQAEQALLGVLVVDADAALHRGRDLHRAEDRRHALGHQRGLLHQAGAEAAALHPVGGAADIQVDLVVAQRLADPGRLGQVRRIAAAQLQRHRMLEGVEAQ